MQLKLKNKSKRKSHWLVSINIVVVYRARLVLGWVTVHGYWKTLNVSVPLISQISRAKQNRETKGCEYQLQAKIGWNYYSISNCVVLIRQNKGAKIILHAKLPTFRAAKLKAFTVYHLSIRRPYLAGAGYGRIIKFGRIAAAAGYDIRCNPNDYIGCWCCRYNWS